MMCIRLAIDVGNTRVKYGVFQGDRLVETGSVSHWHVPALQGLINKYDAPYVIISSGRHLTKKMEAFFNRNQRYWMLDHRSKLPFKNTYQSPETLGKDRMALVAGASKLYPHDNVLIIDAGTCITYDLLDCSNSFLGGNISPGLHMRLQAMHLLTDQLPQVELPQRSLSMGVDTDSAMQVGAAQGAVFEMEGFIQKYRKTFRKLNILLTGGDAPFFVKRLKTKIFVSPHLVLQGLNEILNRNVQILE